MSSFVFLDMMAFGAKPEEFLAKRLTLYREKTSLVVCETKLPPGKPALRTLFLLVTLEPTSDGDHQQCQGLERCPHDRGF